MGKGGMIEVRVLSRPLLSEDDVEVYIIGSKSNIAIKSVVNNPRGLGFVAEVYTIIVSPFYLTSDMHNTEADALYALMYVELDNGHRYTALFIHTNNIIKQLTHAMMAMLSGACLDDHVCPASPDNKVVLKKNKDGVWIITEASSEEKRRLDRVKRTRISRADAGIVGTLTIRERIKVARLDPGVDISIDTSIRRLRRVVG